MRTQQKSVPWHAYTVKEVLRQLQADEHGLSGAEALQRQEEWGDNALPEASPPSAAWIFLRQFQSPLIFILGIAAMVALAAGEAVDASFIALVLLINAVIGGVQEWRAERSAQALQKLLTIRATVVRSGEVEDIDAAALVPGDIVWLEAGNRVPADARLLEAYALSADESLLTGESVAVHKDTAWSGPEATSPADQENMAFAGSVVTRGRAKAVVVATGAATVVGQLALHIASAESGQPPIIRRLRHFSRTVGIVIFLVAGGVAALGIALGMHTPMEMLLFAVALAVSAIPEGLPVALTVALSIAATRMARRGVIVRRLAAVEGLGSCTMIASDKTGTLTCNELTVRRILLPDGTTFDVTGTGYPPIGEIVCADKPVEPGAYPGLQDLLRTGVLCNESDLHPREEGWTWHGDAVDIALLSLGFKHGWDSGTILELYPNITQVPFDAERRYAVSYHRGPQGDVHVFLKGAPERVLAMCALEDAAREAHLQDAVRMARDGYRVLALADGITRNVQPGDRPPDPQQLRFLGFVGMIDPLREGVAEAVRQCAEAGIRMCMVTGDHPDTALAIALQLGFASHAEEVITGEALRNIAPEELPAIMRQARVFARVAPSQKYDIVRAAQEAGHFVAVTGDGVNDAPALRTANIGIAMGKSGTDIAREASELVLSDDNFATIVAGVEEGRIAYDNIRKVLYLLVSTGAAELIALGLAIVTGLPLPLLPVQILWLNLVTNGIQGVALAFEPGEGGALRRPPRSPQEGIFNRLMIERVALAALVIGLSTYAAFLWMIRSGWEVSAARNVILLLMVLFEIVHIANARSETVSAFLLSPLRNPLLLAGTAGAFLLHVAALYALPGQRILGMQPVDLRVWLAIIPVSLSVLVMMEIHKMLWKRRQSVPVS